jgi:hypothetical protein
MSFDYLENSEEDKYSVSNYASGDDQEEPVDLSSKEGEGETPFVFKNTGGEKVSSQASSPKKSKKKFIIGGAGAGIIGLAVAGFIALIPLKIEHIVSNLESHFFGSSESAVSRETENLFSSYFKTLARTCGSTVSKNCHIKFSSSDPVANLFRVWHQNKLETTMADKYGLEIQSTGTGSSRKYYLKVSGASDAELTASEINGSGDIFQEVSRADIRASVTSSLSTETKWKQVLYRFKIGRLLEEKYGIKRCIAFCTARDAFQTTKEDITSKLTQPVKAAKIYLVDRVITPRDKILGTAITCLLSSSCDPTNKNQTSTNPEEAGAPESDFDTSITNTYESLAAQFSAEDAATLESTYASISEEGLSKYLVADMLSTILPDAVANNAADAIPYVGWVNMAAQVINAASHAGPALKAISYAMNAAAAVQLYSMYSTYVDEIHTGGVDSNVVGSFVDSLGPGSGTKTDPETGGTASAEQTPLYNQLINNSTSASSLTTGSQTTSLLNNVFSAATYAASQSSASSSPYLCNNGQPVPAGQTVCSEEKLGGGSWIANDLDSLLGSAELGWLTTIAHIWGDTVGQILNLTSTIFGKLLSLGLTIINADCHLPSLLQPPGVGLYCSSKPLVTKAEGAISKAVVGYLIPSPLSDNNSGGRTFDEMAAGADVAGNTTAQTALGGQKLNSGQLSAIQNSNLNEAQQSFEHQSFFARMFSTSSPYSLVSRLADAIPSGSFATTLQSSFISFFSSPFSKITSSIFSILGSHSVFAATTPQADPFGVTQYGYPLSGPGSMNTDPEAYWNANCSDNAAQAYQNNANFNDPTKNWNKLAAANVDSNTGQAVNTTTNQCLLIEATVGSAGGYFDSSTLTADDLAGSPTSTSTSTANNNSIYEIGDSISIGMNGPGLLSQNLSSVGWQVTQIDDTANYNVSDSLAKIEADSSNIAKSGTVVVELGTNNCDLTIKTPTCDSKLAFESQIESMIKAIRNINPTAQIFWMNTYSTKTTTYQALNSALVSESESQNFTVIDWATEATTNSSNYSFDSATGAYQSTDGGYINMSQFLVKSLGSVPGGG